MIFLDRHEPSLGPKSLFLVMMTAAMVLSGWMMFAAPEYAPNRFQQYLLKGDLLRRILVFSCLLVYFLRVSGTIRFFIKRKLLWAESLIISSIMPFVLLAMARAGGSNLTPTGLVEILGVFLFLIGSYLNTCSEYQRQRFKSHPANKGRLFTSGLFRLARHVNYFGDVLLFSGLALVTGRPGMLMIPLVMALNFVFVLVPRKEVYLREKYGQEFSDYSARTKRFIPYLF